MADIKAAIDALKSAVGVLKANPALLNTPELAFFKDYLQSLGATIPDGKKPQEAPKAAPASSNVHDIESDDDDMPDLETPDAAFGGSHAPHVEEVDSEPEEEEEEPVDPNVMPESEGDVSPIPDMGDPEREPSDADHEKAEEAKGLAMEAMGNGEFAVAVEHFTTVIKLTPAATQYANRGQCFLKMKKPVAAIRDASAALQKNPDSAKAFKVRGKAHALLGHWMDAAKDLGQGQNIDYDEDTFEIQKQVQKHCDEIHKRDARKKAKEVEKEKKRQEKLRKQREREQAASSEGMGGGMPGGFPGMGGMGGFPGMGMGGMGGMGGFPGMGGMGGMPDMSKLMSDPEIMAAMQNPKMMQVFMDIQQNPANLMKYQNDPEVMNLVQKMSAAMGR